MPYVQRNGSGHVTGVYALPQPGYATELLAATDPYVVAFLTPLPPAPDPVTVLQDALVAKGVITVADISAAVGADLAAPVPSTPVSP